MTMRLSRRQFGIMLAGFVALKVVRERRVILRTDKSAKWPKDDPPKPGSDEEYGWQTRVIDADTNEDISKHVPIGYAGELRRRRKVVVRPYARPLRLDSTGKGVKRDPFVRLLVVKRESVA